MKGALFGTTRGVLALIAAAGLTRCDCATRTCPSVLFPCLIGCIPSDGTCCPDGSFCPSATVCVPSGSGFTCDQGGQNSVCPSGQRPCGTACIPSASKCCVGSDCTDAPGKASGVGICPDQTGFILCGQCVGGGGGCSGICRYCSSNSFCGGDICGDVQCRAVGTTNVNSASECGGGGGGGGCSDSQHHLASCPDGSQKCCSVNQVCCHDSANGGAIGCEFQGFCQ